MNRTGLKLQITWNWRKLKKCWHRTFFLFSYCHTLFACPKPVIKYFLTCLNCFIPFVFGTLTHEGINTFHKSALGLACKKLPYIPPLRDVTHYWENLSSVKEKNSNSMQGETANLRSSVSGLRAVGRILFSHIFFLPTLASVFALLSSTSPTAPNRLSPSSCSVMNDWPQGSLFEKHSHLNGWELPKQKEYNSCVRQWHLLPKNSSEANFLDLNRQLCHC